MLIEDALKELGRQMGVPLRLDHNRTCRLVFDERWTVDIEAPSQHHDSVFLYAVAGKVPPGAGIEFYKALLEANLFGRETLGATLAVDSARAEVIVQRIVAMQHVDFMGFVGAIEDLIRALAAWTERLASQGQRPAPRTDDSTFPVSVIRA